MRISACVQTLSMRSWPTSNTLAPVSSADLTEGTTDAEGRHLKTYFCPSLMTVCPAFGAFEEDANVTSCLSASQAAMRPLPLDPQNASTKTLTLDRCMLVHLTPEIEDVRSLE